MGGECMDLPPGFRFYPTDEELITHYLAKKAMDAGFTSTVIRDMDLYRSEPWDLPCKTRSRLGEEECYFFCMRDRKYPSGLRTNRATHAGYWKSTGKDKRVYGGKTLVGMKKTLVFHGGRAPRGEKTNWVMHEYRLEQRCPSHYLLRGAKSEWVICRVFMKKGPSDKEEMEQEAAMDPALDHPPPLKDACKGKEAAPAAPVSDPVCVACLSNARAMEDYERGHMHHHEEFLMNYSSYESPSLVLYNQGAHCSTMHIMQYKASDDLLPKLLEYDSYDLPRQSASQDTGLTSSDMNNPEISSAFVGSLHLDESFWSF